MRNFLFAVPEARFDGKVKVRVVPPCVQVIVWLSRTSWPPNVVVSSTNCTVPLWFE